MAGINAAHARKLRLILGQMHAATTPLDMNLPGLHLHELKGERADTGQFESAATGVLPFSSMDQMLTYVDYEYFH